MSHIAAGATTPAVTGLATGELLLVVSLRLYALPFRDPRGDHPDWRAGFIAAGVGQVAVPAFGGLFDIVSRVPNRPLEIGCPHCRGLGRDEGHFLRLIAFNQNGRLEDAALMLQEWVPPAAARLAAMPALGLAFALQRGGLWIAPREPPQDGRLLARMALPDRGLTMLQ